MIIGITNQKGGVAKTTTSINLAAGLSRYDKKVLVIDMDPQGNLTSGMGVKGPFKKTIYDVLTDDEPIEKAIVETEFKNIHVVPSTIKLANAELELAQMMGRETILKEAISKRIKDKYDYILIDTNPSLGNLSINALSAAQHLIIPMMPSQFAIEGVDHLIKIINLTKKKINRELKIMGILLTRVHPRTNIARDFEREIRELFKDKVFKTKIHENVAIQEAETAKTPLILFDPSAKAALEYFEFAGEILENGEK